MEEMDLISILEDLTDDEFSKLKWCLKRESFNGIPAIKTNQLTPADRSKVVDLLVQKYMLDGAVQVMQSVLGKISRNDLVSQLQPSALKSEDSGPAVTLSATREAQADKPEAKLVKHRSEFIDRVSDPVLLKLLDKLLEQEVITDHEEEHARTLGKLDKARYVIDLVRKKGSAASSILITTLNEVDPCLSEQLKLK